MKNILQKADSFFKKLFGNLDLTWKKLIIWAVIAGIYTGLMALFSIFNDTSFEDISISFEWWILFGILIIVNSNSPLDSALKCFVFFLISQPLVYLVQAPFHWMGLELFKYYLPWFRWTLLTFPMGYIGYYIKRGDWWSLVILAPMLVFVASHYWGFAGDARSFFPHHLLSAIFCAITLVLYPLYILKQKTVKKVGLAISIVLLLTGTAVAVLNRHVYNTTLMSSSEEHYFDDKYEVSLKDSRFGKVYIEWDEGMQCYMLQAQFTAVGDTELIIKAPDGSVKNYPLTVRRNGYDLDR
ncbi:MAG: hypothetical protein II704_01900 [Erysipelotrichaceae bacterium]|nr:hypothetical protein [Erysipelotrichaceae bacterium]